MATPNAQCYVGATHGTLPIYHPFRWELLMALRQLYLVGFAVLIVPGSVEQLVIAFLLDPNLNPNPNPHPDPNPEP